MKLFGFATVEVVTTGAIFKDWSTCGSGNQFPMSEEKIADIKQTSDETTKYYTREYGNGGGRVFETRPIFIGDSEADVAPIAKAGKIVSRRNQR